MVRKIKSSNKQRFRHDFLLVVDRGQKVRRKCQFCSMGAGSGEGGHQRRNNSPLHDNSISTDFLPAPCE